MSVRNIVVTVAIAVLLICKVSESEAVAHWENWSSWAACNATCGGTNYRVRFCLDPVHGSQPTTHCSGPPDRQHGGVSVSSSGSSSSSSSSTTSSYEIQAKNCSSPCQNPGGNWSLWSQWSKCSVTCQSGIRYRGRHCLTDNCVGDPFDQDTCFVNALCSTDIDGGWGTWTSWGTCSTTCGVGFHIRQRVCDSPAPFGAGANCTGSGQEFGSCTVRECPIDGGWSSYIERPCTVTCGVGVLVSTRSCSNPTPQYGGRECNGTSTKFSKCSTTCVVDGGWSEWSDFTSCNVVCGDGYIRRARTCTNPVPNANGAYCAGDAEDKQICRNGACPTDIKTCTADILKGGYIATNTSVVCGTKQYIPQDDMLIETYCSAPADKTKWRLGIEIQNSCDQIPLYSPIAIVDSATLTVLQYGIMIECRQTTISIVAYTCLQDVRVRGYSLTDPQSSYYMLLY